MASTFSTNLALELMGTGDQAGTWGLTTNNNLGTLLEQAISGYVTQAMNTASDVTITIPNGLTGVARNMYIQCTGAMSQANSLIVPANRKLYFIHNNTTGGFAVTVKVTGLTGISVPNGSKVILVCNGTDIVNATSYITSYTPGGSTTQVQYNNAGAFGGTSLTYNNSTGGFSLGVPSSGTALTVAGFAANNAISATGSTPTIQSIAGVGAGNVAAFDLTATGVRAYQILCRINDGNLTFRDVSGSADRMTLDASGNLAIGTTTTSGAKLTVAGNNGILVNGNGAAGYNGAQFVNDNGITLTATCGGSTASGWAQNAATIGTTTSHPLYLGTNNTARMAISNVGNVTINPPNSGTALAITAVSTGTAQSNTVSVGQRVLYGTDGTRAFSIVPTTNGINLATETAHNLVLQTNAADRVTVSNAGIITINAPSSAGNTLTAIGRTGSSSFVSQNATSGSSSEYHFQATNGTDSDFNLLLSQVGAASKYAHLFTATATPLYLGTSATIRVTVTPSGNTTFSGAASTNPVVVTFNATTMTLNAVLSNVFTTTFTAPVTVAPTISNPQDGQTMNWFITQDATGNRTMTWPTSFKWPGGTVGVLSTAANSVDLLVATYRATTGFWYATLSKGFA